MAKSRKSSRGRGSVRTRPSSSSSSRRASATRRRNNAQRNSRPRRPVQSGG